MPICLMSNSFKKNMKITKLICAPGKTGFFFDDQKAIKQGAKKRRGIL